MSWAQILDNCFLTAHRHQVLLSPTGSKWGVIWFCCRYLFGAQCIQIKLSENCDCQHHFAGFEQLFADILQLCCPTYNLRSDFCCLFPCSQSQYLDMQCHTQPFSVSDLHNLHHAGPPSCNVHNNGSSSGNPRFSMPPMCFYRKHPGQVHVKSFKYKCDSRVSHHIVFHITSHHSEFVLCLMSNQTSLWEHVISPEFLW